MNPINYQQKVAQVLPKGKMLIKKQKGKKKARKGARKRRNVKNDGNPRMKVVERVQHYTPSLVANDDPRVQITATFSPDSFRNLFVALASYCAQKNVVNVDTSSKPLQWNAIYGGLLWMLRAGSQQITGTSVLLNTLPRVFDTLFEALKPKQVTYEMGKISYGWKQFDMTTSELGNFPIYGHKWDTTYVVNDNAGPLEVALIAPPIAQPDSQYAAFLSIISSLGGNGYLTTVPEGSSKLLAKDVSAFARVYSYCGNQSVTSLGGAWLDTELELMKLPAPIVAKFTPYQDNSAATDPRLPRSLAASSCDSLALSGWPLHTSFVGYYNKTPPKVNQIDCDQIFVTLALWMSKCKTATAKITGIPPVPFAFSAQDLYLVIRSALLCVYDTQYFTQFLGNNQWLGVFGNAFLGFFVMAHCAGQSIFGNLLVPTIFAENLAALKTRSVGSAGSKNPQAYLPIVGRWYKDTLPNVQLELLDNSMVDLFVPTIPGDEIDFIDCTNGNNFINVQGEYYQNILSDWNGAVNEIKGYSCPVQEIVNDCGPGGLLIAMTSRVETKIVQEESQPRRGSAPPQMPPRLANNTKYVKNKPWKKIKDKEGKEVVAKNVDALPDASVLNLATTNILSRFGFTQEMVELFQVIILPTERTDEFNDVLTLSMLQVMGKYSHSIQLQTYQASIAGTGAGEWNRCNIYANELMTGQGRDVTTKFQEVFAKLITDGHGGLLAGLLGSVVNGIFPGNEALVNTISGIVPF